MTDRPSGMTALGGRTARALTAAIALGLLVLVLTRIGIDQVLTGLGSMGPAAPMLATVIASAGLLISSRELGAVYRFAGASRIGGLPLVRESAEVVLLNAAIPFAGSARRAAVARVRRGASPTRLITGLLVQIAVATTIAGLLVAAALLSVRAEVLVSVTAGSAALLGATVARRRRRSDGAGRPGPAGMRALLRRLVPLAAVRVAMVSMRLWILADALGGGGRLVGRLGAAGLAVAAMLVPLVPGGLGLREALLTSSAGWLDLVASAAMAVALTDRAAALLAGLLVLAAASVLERRHGVVEDRGEIGAKVD